MNAWIYISAPSYIFNMWSLVKHRKYYHVPIPVAARSKGWVCGH
jgi:hypothetical protein